MENYINYSALFLGYFVGVRPLEPLAQQKVDMIKDVNTIQQQLGKGTLSPKQFDELYDGDAGILSNILRDQASLLHIRLL